VGRRVHEAAFVDAEKGRYELRGEFCHMSIDDLKLWLCKFVLEVRQADKNCHPPDSLNLFNRNICKPQQHSLRHCVLL